MSEQLTTQEQQKSTKERFSELRKALSEKIGRAASWLTFDASVIAIADYNEDNPDKYDQDLAFATYEDNLRESHYQDGKEKREYYKDKSIYIAKRIGVYAGYLPGANYASLVYKHAKHQRKIAKDMRASYKQEHGTLFSNARKQWGATSKKLDELDTEKAALGSRKADIDARRS